MGDDSLFYRPSKLLPQLLALRLFAPGVLPKEGLPALRFDPNGVTRHERYPEGPAISLAWNEIRAVAVLPGPVVGREGLCVFPFRPIPVPNLSFAEAFSGSGAGLSETLRQWFGTPIAVHRHNVRGPSLRKLARRLPKWTDGRITLTTERPLGTF